jgi:SAM-dependent methyltransferase
VAARNEQERVWAGAEGSEYHQELNPRCAADIDELYLRVLGVRRTEINRRWFADVPRDARILEVGCNLGDGLALLAADGFSRLYGLEVNEQAASRCRQSRPNLSVVNGSVYEIPYRDGFFDAVFTCGVLIHLPPDSLDVAQKEILRVVCRGGRVLGGEYRQPAMTPLGWRDRQNRMWSGPYRERYMALAPGTEAEHVEAHRITNLRPHQPDRGEQEFFRLRLPA